MESDNKTPVQVAAQHYGFVERISDFAIYMLDRDGNVVSWNAGAEKAKGYEPHEIIGQHFSRFYTEEDRAAGIPESALKTAAETGIFESQGWRVRKDGSRFWAHVVIDPIRDDSGELIGFAKVTRDITYTHELERELAEAKEKAALLQRLELLGQITGGVAHDFNNLLSIIIHALDMALDYGPKDARMKRYILTALDATERGAQLTQQLLGYARLQPLRPEPLDAAASIRSIADLLTHSLPGNISVKTEIAEDLKWVHSDKTNFEMSLMNLALNARDAMPNGGTLTFEARNANGKWVVIDVRDTGHGIPPELLSRVTEPYFTTKGVGKGSGLGLSQAYGFAQQSGGNLSVASTVGKGTTITFTLPAIEGNAAPATEKASGPPLTRVLVVEDNPRIADSAKEILENNGHSVEVAHSADEALNILRVQTFDAVFTDIIMPGSMSGLDLAKEVTRLRPLLPIVLTTGYTAQYTDPDIRLFPLLAKPYRAAELIAEIAKAIGRAIRGGGGSQGGGTLAHA